MIVCAKTQEVLFRKVSEINDTAVTTDDKWIEASWVRGI